jgi:hypothetical protein
MLEDDFLTQKVRVCAGSTVPDLSLLDGLRARDELEIRSVAHYSEQENWGDYHMVIPEWSPHLWEST